MVGHLRSLRIWCCLARPAGVGDFEEGSAPCRLEKFGSSSLTVDTLGDRKYPSSFGTRGAGLRHPGGVLRVGWCFRSQGGN